MQSRIAESDQCAEQSASTLSDLPSALRIAQVRATALYNFYQAERQAGASPMLANERMHEFAKRLDATPEA